MKILIVYYSRSGKTREIAEQLHSKLKGEIEEINDNKNRKGIIGFIASGNEAYLRRMPTIDMVKKDPEQYDVVIIGTPIWAGNISPPARSFIKEYKEKMKKVAFFCTSMGSDPEPVFMAMEKITAQKPMATMNITGRDIKKQYHIEKIDKFIQKIKQSGTG